MRDGAPDPLASASVFDIEVDIGDETYVITGRDARQWLAILLEDYIDLAAVIPGMLGDDDADRLEDELLTGIVTADEVEQAAKHALAVASGHDWWWTLRMMGAARLHWAHLFAPLTAAGVRLEGLPLGAVVDALHYQAVTLMNKEQRQEFDRELEMPPADEVPELDDERESAAFLALMNRGV